MSHRRFERGTRIGSELHGAESVRNVRTEGAKGPRGQGVKGPPSLPPPASISVPPPAGESRFLRVARVILGVAMIVGIGSGAAWTARRYVRTSPRFAVSEIATDGGKHLTADGLANIANITKGQNIFSIDLENARSRLVSDPWIESAEVHRRLPGTISISVVEREAAGIVAMPEGTYLVTREGAILKRLEPGDPVDFHVVTGLAVNAFVDDRDGATRTIRRALDLANDYDRSPIAKRSPIEEVHVEPNGDMTLVIGKSGTTLRMGAGPYRRKLEHAARTVAELDRRNGKPSAIMLDDEARPERVVVRMR